MKKLSILAIFAFIATFALSVSAQDKAMGTVPAAAAKASPLKLTAGTISVGGNIYYSSDSMTVDYDGNETDIDRSTITFNPSFGYFLQNNLELIGQINYTTEEVDDDDQTTMGLGVGANYYIPLNEKLVLSAGGMVMFNTQEAGETDITQYGVVINASVLYPLTMNLAVTAGLNINYMMGTVDTSGMEGDLSNFGFQLGYFGIKGFF